jgi:glucokinase
MERGRIVVGVDMGGTKIAAALLRVDGDESWGTGRARVPAVLRQVQVPTDTSSASACLRGLLDCIAGLTDSAADVAAIGIGIAATVDFAGGRVATAVHLPLADVGLREIVVERFAVPTAIDNDALVATLAERAFGAGTGARDLIMLTLGTGVGGGIICDGRPYRGLSGQAGELGHIVIDLHGPKCPGNCPNHGCLEAYVAGPAIGAAAEAEARAKPDSALGRALLDGSDVDGALLSELALNGDADAVGVLARCGEYLGVGITTLVNIFNPELVVVGGGAAAAGELLLEPARRVLAQRGLRPARDQVRIVPAELGPDAGFFGAAVLALTEASPGPAGGPS